uniref:ABC-2 type transporter transmembrane domain-containing protein n=4 Tax=cellular organisms TaxID=131567 RepID=A0A914Y8X0_9BILA
MTGSPYIDATISDNPDPLLLSRDAGDVAVYAGVSVYSRRAVSRVAADSVFYLQPVFTQYPGDGAADFHDNPQPVQCRSGRSERGFSAVDYAFRLYFSDRQYARGDPRGDVHYSRSLFRQHPAKPVPRREYSSGAGGKRAVFDRFGGDVYRPDVILFPFAATLEVTNATIAIYDEDNGEHSVELTQRFARASAFTHVLLLKSPQEIRPTIDTQKALLLVRFPADFSRKLDTFQTAPLQLILDGRNSNSAQIAANYLQQIVKNYQQELLEGKPKPNNSELVVRNWYNPNLDYKWFVVPSLIAMITTIGVMIVTSLSVAREREQGHHCAGDWYLGVSNPLRRIAGAVLLYDGDLRFIAGGIRSVDFITLLDTTAGVYRRVCLYDARHSPFRLRFAGGKHASLAAKPDVD